MGNLSSAFILGILISEIGDVSRLMVLAYECLKQPWSAEGELIELTCRGDCERMEVYLASSLVGPGGGILLREPARLDNRSWQTVSVHRINLSTS